MRVRHFPIACEVLGRILATGVEHCFRVSSGFPDDARVRGAFTEGETIILVVESREFPEVSGTEAPPSRSILLEDRRADMRKAAAGS